jgi:sugar lactone lactonase YvrE
MGLHFFDVEARTFKKFLSNEEGSGNLTQRTITAIYLDRGGVLWVGTKRGLNKFDTYAKNFEAYKTTLFDGAKNIITGLQESEMGGYWVSTVGGGLFRLQNGSFHSINIRKSENDEFANFIQTILVDSRGNIWLATAGSGLYRFNEKDYSKNNSTVTSFDHFYTKSKLALNNDFIMSLEEDINGNIWVGTWGGGLNRITPGGQVYQYNQPELKNVPLVAMHADLSGALWVGTRGNGLYRVKARDHEIDLEIFQQGGDSASSISNNVINAIYEDHGGKLWIGTDDGLNSFDRRTKKFSVTEIKGPGKSAIVSILEDDFGKLWLANWDGLTVIDPMDPNTLKTTTPTIAYWVVSFTATYVSRTRTGRLMFAGSDGFNIINPASMASNPNQGPLVIQNFQVLNQPVPFGKHFNDRILLDKPISKADVITLKHFENTISFEFAALDFAAPDKIRYAYQLDGLDKDWTYTDASRRYVNYTEPDLRQLYTQGEGDEQRRRLERTSK